MYVYYLRRWFLAIYIVGLAFSIRWNRQRVGTLLKRKEPYTSRRLVELERIIVRKGYRLHKMLHLWKQTPAKANVKHVICTQPVQSRDRAA